MLAIIATFFLFAFSKSSSVNVYIADRLQPAGNGSLTSPYNNFLIALVNSSTIVPNGTQLNFLFLTDFMAIVNSDITSLSANLTKKGNVSQLLPILSNFTMIRIMPYLCYQYMIAGNIPPESCPYITRISIKADNFTILVNTNFYVQNIQFDGNDMNIVYNNLTDFYCYYSYDGCCRPEYLVPNPVNNRCVLARPTITRASPFNKYSLFYVTNDNNNTELQIINCQFNYINGIGMNWGFSTLVATTYSNLINFTLVINSTLFSYNYLKDGMVQFLNTSIVLLMNNITVNNYNYYVLTDNVASNLQLPFQLNNSFMGNVSNSAFINSPLLFIVTNTTIFMTNCSFFATNPNEFLSDGTYTTIFLEITSSSYVTLSNVSITNTILQMPSINATKVFFRISGANNIFNVINCTFSENIFANQRFFQFIDPTLKTTNMVFNAIYITGLNFTNNTGTNTFGFLAYCNSGKRGSLTINNSVISLISTENLFNLADNLQLTNITINLSSFPSGVQGAIYSSSGSSNTSLIMGNLVISNISATNVLFYASFQLNISLSNSTFEYISTTFYGLFYGPDYVTFIIQSCSFTQINGSIYTIAYLYGVSTFSMINSNFTNIFAFNPAGQYGMIVMINAGNSLIENVTFTNLTSNSQSGIMELQVGNCNLTNVEVYSSSSYSGPLFSFSSLTLQLQNVFIKDSVSLIGQEGLIYIQNCEIQIINTKIILTKNSQLSRWGGCFNLNSLNQLNITNSSFFNIYIFGNDGGIANLIPFNNITIDNCSFFNISAYNQLGAIFYIQQNSTLNFLNSYVDIYNCLQGAIYSSIFNFIFINNSIFMNGYTQQEGGLIYLDLNSSLVINNSIFMNLSTIIEGSVVYLNQFINFTLQNSVFNNNYCGSDGAVIYLYLTNELNIFNSSFSWNSAASSGGTIDIYQTNIVNVNLSYFFKNQAIQEGGAINLEESNILNISDTIFDGCNASNGGVLRMFHNNSLNFQNLQFINTNSEYNGGVFLAFFQNQINFSNCSFSNISAAVYGALGVVETGNYLYFLNINIEGSYALSRGGVLYAEESNYINFTFSNFQDSYSLAESGGFLYMRSGNFIQLLSCSVFQTWALNNGGLIYLFYSNQLIIKNTTISNSESNQDYAGCIYSYHSNFLNINDSMFVNISSGSSGGVFYFSAQNELVFVNNTVRNIINFQDSGAFFNIESLNSILIANSTIWDINSMNVEAVFIYVIEENYVNFSNCSIIAYSSPVIYNSFIYSMQNNSFFFNNVSFAINYTNYVFIIASSNISLTSINFNNLTSCMIWGSFSQSNITLHSVNFKLIVQMSLFSLIDSEFSLCDFLIDPIVLITNIIQYIDAQNSTIKLRKGCFKVNFEVISMNFISASLFSNLTLDKITFSGMMNANSLPYFILPDIFSLKIKACTFLCTTNLNFGGLFSLNSSQTLNFTIYRSIFAENRAQNEGGSIYFQQSNQSSLSILRSLFYNNRASKGGAISLYNVTEIIVNNSKFIRNKADPQILKQTTINTKGGALYLESLISNFTINLENSWFINNSAQSGGLLYKNGWVFLEINNCSLKNNNASYYGNNFASEIKKISFVSDDLTMKFNSMTLLSIGSGVSTDTSYLIAGIDDFDNLAYMAENFSINSLLIQEYPFSSSSLSNQFSFGSIIGFLDLTGPFSRLGFPIAANFSYLISLKNGYIQTNDKLQLSLNFRSCLSGERLYENYTCLECNQGEYSFNLDFTQFSQPCSICYDFTPFYCFGGSRLTPKPNYWRENDESSNFLQCNKDVCQGDPRDSSSVDFEYLETYAIGVCSIGYNGILCDQCAVGYGKMNQNTCDRCNGSGYGLSLIIELVLRVVFTLFSISTAMNLNRLISKKINEYDDNAIASNAIKVFINHIQVLSVALYLPFKWPDDLSYSLSIAFSLTPSISDSLNLQCVLEAFNSNMKLLYFKVICTLIYPFLLLMICLVVVLLSKATKKHKTEMKFFWYPVSLSMTIFLLCYSDVIQVLLQMLGHENFGDDLNVDYRVVQDKSIVYYSDEHQFMIRTFAVPLIVIIGILFPFIILFYLLHKRMKKKLYDEIVLFNFGFYIYTFKENYFFWDLLTLLRKISILFVQLYLFSYTQNTSLYPLNIVETIILLSLMLQINIKPYKQKEFPMINTFETNSLITLFLTYYFAILYLFKIISEEEVSVLYTCICGLIPAIANIFFAWNFIHLYYKHNILSKVKKVKEIASSGLRRIQTFVRSATKKMDSPRSGKKARNVHLILRNYGLLNLA